MPEKRANISRGVEGSQTAEKAKERACREWPFVGFWRERKKRWAGLAAAHGASGNLGAAGHAQTEKNEDGQDRSGAEGQRAEKIDHPFLQIHFCSMRRFLLAG